MSVGPPVVTGISPNEGVPGTRVTIRGENLGTGPDDIIGLTISGVECVSIDWKSPSKIIAQCGVGKSYGDVIVTTKSGGRGTSTVQFQCFIVGQLDSCEIWIDESYLMNQTWERKRPTSPSELHKDNPLGLSDEGDVKKIPEDTLQKLFPEGSGNLTSENFVPAWFLLKNHNTASFDDLKTGLNYLRRRVNSQKEGELSFLKANVDSVMDQQETLNNLIHRIRENKSNYNGEMTDKLEEIIKKAKVEADELFQEVLRRKDRADGTRNALSVLQRFKFLFHLPCTIERNIQKGDYDVVINDYARAKSLFADTEVTIFKKVYQEVEQRISNFREELSTKLKNLPLPLEEQKRLVRYLVNLETSGDPAWNCISYQYTYIVSTLKNCKDYHLAQDQISPEETNTTQNKSRMWSQNLTGSTIFRKDHNLNALDQSQICPPEKILFVEELTEILCEVFPDLWKLGQAYFKGDLTMKEVGNGKSMKLDTAKHSSFRAMVLDAIELYSNLFRAAILPQTLGKVSPSHRPSLGQWSISPEETLGGWLPQCVRYIRTCYLALINLDLPKVALNIIQQLIFDLRVHSINIMFKQATEDVRNLYSRETWVVEVDDNHGGTTKLPILYKNIVVETFQLVKETVLQSGPQEAELTDHPKVQISLLNLIKKLLQAFPDALRILIFQPECQSPTSENKSPVDFTALTQEKKMMVVLSNCNFTVQYVLLQLQENIQKNICPNVDSITKDVIESFGSLHNRVFEAYMELKSNSVIGSIEISMYSGDFDWNKCPQPDGARPYIKEILNNMIAVHAEVFAVSPMFINQVMTRLTELVTEELCRLFLCIPKFSHWGNLQGRIDLIAFQDAITQYKTDISNDHLKKAMNYLPPITNMNDEKLLEDNLNKFKNRMKLHLMCFQHEICSEA